MTELDEHAEVLPAGSVAVARNVVEEVSATATLSPGDARAAAEPVAATAPVHDASVYSRTVEPASAVPLIVGELSLAGESGSVSLSVGGPGAVVSTTHVRVAGVGSVLPAASMARIASVCAPSASAVSNVGDTHAAQAPASSLHSNVDAACEEENAKLDDAEAVVPGGPESIVVCGGAVSIVNVLVAGVASVLPA